MAEPRVEAVKILVRIEKEASYSAIAVSDALRKLSFDDKRDSAFTVSLIYGVLEHKLTLDYNISLYLKAGIRSLKANVLNIIRVGAYQILYLDKIPVSAAVNEAVKTTKKLGASYSSGLVNAVLRKIAANGLRLPENDKTAGFLSVANSVDEGIAEHLVKSYGYDKTEKIFKAFSGRRPIYIRMNTLVCNEKQLTDELEKDGVNITPTSLHGCYAVENTGDIAALSAYKKGYFHVQDMSSQLCCSLLGVTPGDRVLDCCAAPGGKSFTLAQYLEGKGSITSCDIYEHKTKLISDGAKRLSIKNLSAICKDASTLHNSDIRADKVLCDVPCSGIGVIGRKPEIRYKKAEELSTLPEIQKAILYSAAKTLESGGTLIYSTCTLNPDENENICDAFLADFPDFYVSEDEKYRKYTDRYITVFPSVDSGDGFFIAEFTKR